ncbi:hypothetical protein C0Q70_05869 [Pomacea canaliculata]|uniref:Delta-like protein n=1 Tax=Pomacea canaliculata TaxID=400727 RepID=A0A2T7PMF2_POMCA|nr:hypothetical protein C0Q70_05869 [Pomacea canaliculata]
MQVFYTVVVEAWHDQFGNRSVSDPSNVIARVLHAGRLLPSYRWQNVSSSFRGTHFSIRFRVVCDRNYYGPRCDVLCKKSDNPIIGHYACDDNGSRVCLDGWEGESCDKAKCSEACQEGRGYCDKPYECRCHLGWKGTECHQCQTYPGCLHGYCIHAWQCICHQDWSGSHCNIDNHYCQRYSPCKNGGTCAYDEVTNYTCSCPQGFGGVNCAHTVCYDGYCLNNGLCVMSAGRRSCRCRRGFDGHRCQNAEVTCGHGVCRNNGTCRRDGGNIRCLCRPGFKGDWCEVEMAECQSNPCKHGGVCRDRVNGYHCECRTGYGGKSCELSLDPCIGFRCFNHGSCISTAIGFTPSCLCRPEFTGQRCESPLDPCVGIYCLHGGTCLRIGNTEFQCACANEYTGSVCQIPPPSVVCKDQPCLHGGTCRRTHEGNMMCACAPGFRGALCESQVPVAALSTIADVVDDGAGEEDTLTPPQEGPKNLQVPNDSVCLHICRAAIALWVTVCTTVTVLLRYT